MRFEVENLNAIREDDFFGVICFLRVNHVTSPRIFKDTRTFKFRQSPPSRI